MEFSKVKQRAFSRQLGLSGLFLEDLAIVKQRTDCQRLTTKGAIPQK